MAFFRHFKKESNLPNPHGPLAQSVPSTSIAAANLEVRAVIDMTSSHNSKKRGCYEKYTPEQKAMIGKRAAEHGVASSVRHYIKDFLNLKENTVKERRNAYRLEFKKRVRNRRVFSSVTCIRALYLSLVRSRLLYCSPIWHPHLLTDIRALENVQRRATKFILNDHLTDYRQRLVSLNLLPLMMIFEIIDIIFFIKCLKQPSKRFNILSFVTFCSSQTRSSTYFKPRHLLSRKNYTRHFYFN